ncbi:YuiA family protein [Bacillus carboniphilus]|uniref:YuiA family protein n=1 Tax=Bacillus carboniphilus TaxID=86663 RepID=A0ABY9JSQ2_9BACI|nr:YuiA family protein [Bacillus carboniphilus]WLR41283.1 YuiA family protein [Bacillus carboniphilus]
MYLSSSPKNQCPYCSGKGYFQLLLGGSETCSKCQGTGVTDETSKITFC